VEDEADDKLLMSSKELKLLSIYFWPNFYFS